MVIWIRTSALSSQKTLSTTLFKRAVLPTTKFMEDIVLYMYIFKNHGDKRIKSFSLKRKIYGQGHQCCSYLGILVATIKSKTIAAQVQSQWPSSKSSSPIHFFALDFREDLSAFSGHFLEAQAEFINTCVRFILDNCNARANEKGVVGPKSVLIIAHSMGGISARGAVFSQKIISKGQY